MSKLTPELEARIRESATPEGLLGACLSEIDELRLEIKRLHQWSKDCEAEDQELRVQLIDGIGTCEGCGRRLERTTFCAACGARIAGEFSALLEAQLRADVDREVQFSIGGERFYCEIVAGDRSSGWEGKGASPLLALKAAAEAAGGRGA